MRGSQHKTASGKQAEMMYQRQSRYGVSTSFDGKASVSEKHGRQGASVMIHDQVQRQYVSAAGFLTLLGTSKLIE